MQKQGYFISVEGTDGCGKTTQLKNIREYLENKGYDVLMLREPGGTKIGEKIRDIIIDSQNVEMTNVAEMLLYAAARAQIVGEVILPAIKEGRMVVCDRFVDSSLVYQGVARGIGMDNVMRVNILATQGILPNMTLFLDIDPKISLSRRFDESKPDRIESLGLEFQYKVYDAYKQIAKENLERIKTIDATSTVEQVFEEIKKCINELIGSDANEG